MATHHDVQYQALAEPYADGPHLPAWQPQTVDQVPRRHTLTTAVLATALATFVPAPGALEAAARATFPDQIARGQTHASRQQAFAYAPAPLGDGDLRWTPTYPSRLDPVWRLDSARQQSLALVIPPGVAVAPILSWAPRYPDRVPHPSGLLAPYQQAFAAHPVPLPDVAPVPTHWTPTFPAALAARPGITAAAQQAIAHVLGRADQALSTGSAGTLVRRPAQIQYQALTGPVLVPALAPPLSWQARYPDQHTTRRPTRLPSHVTPLVPLDAATPRTWAPTFPDRIPPRAGLAAVQHLAVAFVSLPGVAVVPPGSWQPSYPDALAPHVTLRPALQSALAFWPQPLPTIFPQQSWQPTYPVAIAARPFPVAARTFRVDPPSPTLPVPALSWAPTYPSRLVRPWLVVALQRPFAFAPEPVVDIAVPELAWASVYPDRIPRLVVAAAQQQAFALAPEPLPLAALVPLAWAAVYPSTLPAPARPRALGSIHAAPPELIEVVVQTAPWRPTFPDWLARAPLPPLAPWPLGPTPRTVLAGAHTCIELRDLTATQSRLVLTGVTQSCILGPEATTLAGSSFEVC